jgi:hypothetical protein
MNIHDDSHVITYLQVGEILVILTPKEQDGGYSLGQVVQMEKWFPAMNVDIWMSTSSSPPKTTWGLIWYVHKELGHFGVQQTYNFLQTRY